ncbi:50S ribosomal protein L18 [Bartonella taylorii]|uniref:50S ribosomal protein L18 n=1 Tax=Bartonella taylorii TaxID=33046 RepID=UPI001ABB66C2|nr:50S ribosomal protein L18 [Bartonella taylorii]
MVSSKNIIQRRARRVRRRIKMVSGNRPRLSVYRSNQNIYAQIIDDLRGCTLVSASTLEGDLKKSLKSGADKEAAFAVGKLIAERAKQAGVNEVVFDRGAYVYHGRVKALAEAAREGGLSF